MKSMMKRFALGIVVAVFVGLPLYAQQVNILTRGTGGVGRLDVGVGTAGVVTFDNDRTTLTNAQVLALNTTAVNVVAAPGAGFYIDVIDGALVFNYTAAYATMTSDMRLFYGARTTGNAASSLMETTGFLDATADTVMTFSGTPDDTKPTVNSAVAIQADTLTAFTSGNASNQVFVDVTYIIRRTGL